MKNSERRYEIVKKANEKSDWNGFSEANQPSWVRKAIIGAGLIASVSIGACSSKKENTTVENPPPRKRVVETGTVVQKENPQPKQTPPKKAPKPVPPPMDQEVPIYGIR